MSRHRTATLFVLCTVLAACHDTPDNDPTGPELVPAGAEPQNAELQWAFLRLTFPVVWRQTTEPPPAGRVTLGTSFSYATGTDRWIRRWTR